MNLDDMYVGRDKCENILDFSSDFSFTWASCKWQVLYNLDRYSFSWHMNQLDNKSTIRSTGWHIGRHSFSWFYCIGCRRVGGLAYRRSPKRLTLPRASMQPTPESGTVQAEERTAPMSHPVFWSCLMLDLRYENRKNSGSHSSPPHNCLFFYFE